MNRIWIGCLIAFGLEVAALPMPRARADLPVIDTSTLTQMVQQVQQAIQTVSELRQTVTTLMDVPEELIGQVQGLLDISVSNPLQNILGNLTSLLNGSGTGTCSGAAGLLSLNQYAAAVPSLGSGNIDFAGASLNGIAAQGAGLLACTNQMMQATQTRLSQMPQLLDELKGCTDITCEQGISGRIQLEEATIQAQTQQAILVGQTAQMQRWMAQDRIDQKMRADAQAEINATGGAGAGTDGSPQALAPAPMFSAFGG